MAKFFSSIVGSIINTATIRQSSITFSGTAINGLLGALFYILSAKYLGPQDFGMIFISITTLTLVSDIADLGTHNALVRFVGSNIQKDKEKAFKFLKLALKIKVLSSLVVAVCGFVLAPIIAEHFFKKPMLSFYLQLAFLGVLSAQLMSFATGAFQSLQKFKSWSILQVGTNFFRLLLIGFLIFVSALNLTNTLIIYILTPLLGFFISLLFIPRSFLKVGNENSVAKQMFSYSKWVAVFTLIAAVSARLDTFISARLLSFEEVGLYGNATQLVTIVPQTVVALGTVIAPKMASMGSLIDLKKYLFKLQLFTGVLCLLGLLAIPLASLMIKVILPSYEGSIILFSILLLAMLVFLFSVPIHQAIFYYFGYPKLFVYLSIGHMLIIAILGWNLISLYGPIGAAFTVLIGTIFNFLVPLIWVIGKLNEKKL